MEPGRGRARLDAQPRQVSARGRGVLSPQTSPTAAPAAGSAPDASRGRMAVRGRGSLPPTPVPGPCRTVDSPTSPTQGLGRGSIAGPSRAPAPTAATSSGDEITSRAPAAPAGLSLRELTSALQLSSKADPLYTRPDRGTKGREIALQSNLFKIEFTDTTWYKYDVEIATSGETSVELKTAGASNKDRIQSRRFNREIIWELFKKHRKALEDQVPAYDGRKTLICSKHFFDEHIFTVDMPMNERGRSKQFIVKLKFTLMIDVNQVRMFYEDQSVPLNLEVLQATNIVVDSALGRLFTAVNRSYYDTGIRGIPLSSGKELKSGIYTSAIFAEWQPLLVVDKSNTAFYTSKNMIDYIGDFLGDRQLRFTNAGIPQQRLALLIKDVKGLVVRLTHAKNGRSVKIHSVTEQPANRLMFQNADGAQQSVADYFTKTYHALRYPHLPCVTVVKANNKKTDYYPLEVCEVKENQPYRKKLNSQQTREMIKNCQEPPHKRLQQAVENVRTICSKSGNTLLQHGIKISNQPVRTIGRQIESPKILVKDRSIPVKDGRWRQDEFHVGVSLSQWVVADCANCGPNTKRLIDLICSEARKMRLESVQPPLRLLSCAGMSTDTMLMKVKENYRDKSKPLMAVIILGPDTNYSQIKRLSETTAQFNGIITQCVRGENVQEKLSPMFVNNLLKKMNAKLGGINNSIQKLPKRFASQPYIIIGADVSHPGVGDCMTPSIAAVVGSLDRIPSKYCTITSVQNSENNNRIEYIKDLKNIAKLLLLQFYRTNQRKPMHIYYIRDGVSEGQFDEVRHREITALREACQSLEAEYKPPMTVIIAQKRHHTRFNVVNREDGLGKTGNVPPGTYIDRDVVHPKNFDLYMYTHLGLLGTSRPTHYHVIHADEPITTDEVTEIIYHLCHCYARTSSSVSIPAPVYYAHLAAFRAKEHVKGDSTLFSSERQSVSSGDAQSVDIDLYRKACTVNERYRTLLYYA